MHILYLNWYNENNCVVCFVSKNWHRLILSLLRWQCRGPRGRDHKWSWIYNYLCNKCISPLTFWRPIPLRRGVLDITLCDKAGQWLVAGLWFSTGTPVSSTNKTDRRDIADLLLKVLNTKALTLANVMLIHIIWDVKRIAFVRKIIHLFFFYIGLEVTEMFYDNNIQN